MTSQNQIVFISYSHDDNLFVNSFAGMLSTFELNVWKDSKNISIGSNILKSVYNGIKSASHFCCIISSSSIKSAWVEEELSYAKIRQLGDSSLHIVPVLIDKVEIPDYLKPYRCAHLENRDLSIKNSEFLMILKAFGIDLEGYEREVITGKERKVLLRCCNQLRSDLVEFRQEFGEFQHAYNEYTTAIRNRGYDKPRIHRSAKSKARFSNPTTYGSDYRIKKASERAMNVLRRIKVNASKVQASVELVKGALEEADPSHSAYRLRELFAHNLGLASYISETIIKASDAVEKNWWVREKMSAWVMDLPRVEAALEGAITLLRSWARFDPFDEEGSRDDEFKDDEFDDEFEDDELDEEYDSDVD